MARQLRIVGTEREDHPEIEEACLSFDNLDAEWGTAGKRRETKRHEINALLRLRKLDTYKYWSKVHHRYRIAKLEEQDPKLKFVDTDEGDGEVAEEVAAPDADVTPAGLDSQIAEAQRSQDETNVAETPDGDVTVPEKAAPKAKRKASARKSDAKGKGKKR